MHDPYGSVDAYAAGVHDYINVPFNTWLALKVVFKASTYDVYVYQGDTKIGEILNKPNNTGDIYDQYPEFLNSLTAGNGRLFFGSWFSTPDCPDNSYGHTYIDNIRVY